MRTIVVTGAASGIGKATMNLLRDRADSVIGVDIHDADVVVDLSTAQGRVEMVHQVEVPHDGAVDHRHLAGEYLARCPVDRERLALADDRAGLRGELPRLRVDIEGLRAAHA